MKKLIVLMLIATLISGCASPLIANDDTQLKEDYAILLSDYNSLMKNCESEGNAKEELATLRAEHNKLIGDYNNLQTQYAVLETYLQSVIDQYNTLLPQLGLQNFDKDKALKELAKQLEETEDRQQEITRQLELVRNEKVALLSENLTDIEYSAFYKGWELWWWTFNEKDIEE